MISKTVFLATLVLFVYGLVQGAIPVALAICGTGFFAGFICGKVEQAIERSKLTHAKRRVR